MTGESMEQTQNSDHPPNCGVVEKLGLTEGNKASETYEINALHPESGIEAGHDYDG